MKISIICPTRNRPSNIIRLINTFTEKAKHPENLEFCFYVDEDDSASISLFSYLLNNKVKYFIGPRILLSEMSNVLATKVSTGDILLMAGDDLVCESRDWDETVIEEFATVPDGILLVYGKDGIQNEALATHPFVSRKWIDLLGYLIPPLFTGDYADNWIMDTAKGVSRVKYLPFLALTHYHVVNRKADWDATYYEKYLKDQNSKPAQVMENNKPLMLNDIKKLEKYINSYAGTTIS